MSDQSLVQMVFFYEMHLILLLLFLQTQEPRTRRSSFSAENFASVYSDDTASRSRATVLIVCSFQNAQNHFFVARNEDSSFEHDFPSFDPEEIVKAFFFRKVNVLLFLICLSTDLFFERFSCSVPSFPISWKPLFWWESDYGFLWQRDTQLLVVNAAEFRDRRLKWEKEKYTQLKDVLVKTPWAQVQESSWNVCWKYQDTLRKRWTDWKNGTERWRIVLLRTLWAQESFAWAYRI